MKNSKPTSSAAQHLSSNSIPAAAFLPIKQLISLAYLAVEFPPSPQPWDDFLDFSRMKLPQDFWTVSCRLERNLNYRFKGNYFILWLLGIIIAGTLFMDYLFFLSLSFLIVAWFIICITSVNPIHWKQLTGRGGGRESILIKKKKKCHEQQEQKYIGMENERVSEVPFFCRCATRSSIKTGL
jgi:PRA1 family protein.